MGFRLTLPLDHHCRTAPDAIATSYEGRRHSWYELRERVGRLAGALRSLGLEAGDRIAVLADNADYYLEALLAIWWAGGAVNLVNIRWSAAEIAYSLDDCDTRILIVDRSFAALVPELRMKSSALQRVIFVEESGRDPEGLSFEKLIASSDAVADAGREGTDIAGVFYTGGTTGFPKGVVVTHDSIATNTLLNLIDMPLDANDVVLTVAPMFHLAGLCTVLRALFRGSRCSFIPRFEEGKFLEVAEAERASFTLLVPVMIQRLLDSGADLSSRLASLRLVQYGASPISETILRRIVEALPHVDLVQGYGMTETSGPYTVLPAWIHKGPNGPDLTRLRSAGRPVCGVEMRIVGPDGHERAPGEVGEIICRGPTTMARYWNKDDLTRDSLRDGWMHSGDMGYVDDRGFLFIVDRLKDMIVSGGENVYSAEVENALAKHAAVAACAVIGVPSEQWGEQVHGIVILKPGTSATFEELRAHCKALIAGYKCPASIEFRDELPYSSAGKLQKHVLREPYWSAHSRRVS